MKKPLNYQVTEYDCGKISVENAFSFLFEREEIPSEVIKLISSYTLDCYDEKGNIGAGGTSRKAMSLLSDRLNEYSKAKKIPVFSKHLTGTDVTLELIYTTLKYNGVMIYRTLLEGDHYVLITKIDGENVYMWDPYYLENYKNGVDIIYEQPFMYNRKIPLVLFCCENNGNYSMGQLAKRECLILHRIK